MTEIAQNPSECCIFYQCAGADCGYYFNAMATLVISGIFDDDTAPDGCDKCSAINGRTIQLSNADQVNACRFFGQIPCSDGVLVCPNRPPDPPFGIPRQLRLFARASIFVQDLFNGNYRITVGFFVTHSKADCTLFSIDGEGVSYELEVTGCPHGTYSVPFRSSWPLLTTCAHDGVTPVSITLP